MNPHDLIRTIAQEYGIEPEELMGKSRSTWLVKARGEAYGILKKMGMSSPDIGRIFTRDHTTILHHLKKKAVDNSGLPNRPPVI